MRSNKLAALAVSTVVGWYAAAGVASADPEPAPPPPGPASTTIDGTGTFQVGTDIAPGTYSSAGPADNGACYWKRMSGDTLVDNAMSKKAQVVQIDATDTSFKTSDCQQWQMIDNCLPGCGPQGAAPADILGQLGRMMLRPAPDAPAPGGTGPQPGPSSGPLPGPSEPLPAESGG